MMQGCGQALMVTELKSQFRLLVQRLGPSLCHLNWEENVALLSKVRDTILLSLNMNEKVSAEKNLHPYLS